VTLTPLHPSTSLAGKVIVITGAAGGLGPVVARQTAAAGAALVLCGHDEVGLDELRADLGLGADRLVTVAADLTDIGDVARLADTAESWHGRVDAVLHLVGGWRGGMPLAAAPSDEWPWLVHRIVTTTVLVVRAFAVPLKAAAAGRFITVSSPRATAPTSSNAAYGAAKAAADAWVLALADEFKGSAATANILVVPAIATPRIREAEPEAALGSFVDAETIAAAMLALCAEVTPGLNGQRITLPTRGGA